MRYLILAVALWTAALPASEPARDSLALRGQRQGLRLYGVRGNPPAIVSSGDGGWTHLAPQVAGWLAARGYFVVGLDTRAYLSSFTSSHHTLRVEDVPRDFLQLAAYASAGSSRRPVLVGISEGAGLSVLAAGDPAVSQAIEGVVGLGIPDVTELGWRWKDSLIYLTHGVPKEPTFQTAAVVARMAPVPLALIHSSHDEFVPLARMQAVFEAAGSPKKQWIVEASDHRFSDNQDEFGRRLQEALTWVSQRATDR